MSASSSDILQWTGYTQAATCLLSFCVSTSLNGKFPTTINYMSIPKVHKRVHNVGPAFSQVQLGY